MTVPADARHQVVRRAEDRYQYFGLSQVGQEETIRGRHPPLWLINLKSAVNPTRQSRNQS